MLKIDSHQHFWIYDPVRDSWISEDMPVIRRDFLPADLEPVLKSSGMDGCIAVQADQSEAESDFLLSHAGSNDFIKGVVGWVDLQASNVEERLDYYSGFNNMKGFRHILQGDPDCALMLKPDFKRGIKALHKHGFTYDILIFPDQLEYALSLVKTFPQQKFVIDHLAKPYIKDKRIEEWKKDISVIAEHENVWCKVSGIVTEADWKNWKEEDFKPYLDVVFEVFGTKRLMFGSDWPVCLLAAEYRRTVSILQNYTAALTAGEQADFWGGNAAEFYNLN